MGGPDPHRGRPPVVEACGHAERSIINEYGVNQILRLYTEREPCAPLVCDIEEVTWSFQWNPDAVRDASNARH